jgi:hypothetical protein
MEEHKTPLREAFRTSKPEVYPSVFTRSNRALSVRKGGRQAPVQCSCGRYYQTAIAISGSQLTICGQFLFWQGFLIATPEMKLRGFTTQQQRVLSLEIPLSIQGSRGTSLIFGLPERT